ncbi:MAG: hypothetical protein Q8Q62_19720, partial [Mesorhizobium sp.]|nr:hypothetical protein [Mesorhizobium sp.]
MPAMASTPRVRGRLIPARKLLHCGCTAARRPHDRCRRAPLPSLHAPFAARLAACLAIAFCLVPAGCVVDASNALTVAPADPAAAARA